MDKNAPAESKKAKRTPLWLMAMLPCYIPFPLFIGEFIAAHVYGERTGGIISGLLVPQAVQQWLDITALLAVCCMLFAFFVIILALIRRRITIALLLIISGLLNFIVLLLYIFTPILA